MFLRVFFFLHFRLLFICVFGPGSVAMDGRRSFPAHAHPHTGCVDRDLLSLPTLSVEVHPLFVPCPERPPALTSARSGEGHVIALDLGAQLAVNTKRRHTGCAVWLINTPPPPPTTTTHIVLSGLPQNSPNGIQVRMQSSGTALNEEAAITAVTQMKYDSR